MLVAQPLSKVEIESKIDSIQNVKKELQNKISTLDDEMILFKKKLNEINIQDKLSAGLKLKTKYEAKLKVTPKPDAEILCTIPPGEMVNVFDREMGYLQISYKNYYGYANDMYFEESQDLQQIVELAKIKKEENRKQKLIEKYNDLGIVNQILDGYITIGMTMDMVQESIGSPLKRTKYKSDYSNQETWIYPDDKYLHFEGNVLTSISEY